MDLLSTHAVITLQSVTLVPVQHPNHEKLSSYRQDLPLEQLTG
jgi:hypothetical protein